MRQAVRDRETIPAPAIAKVDGGGQDRFAPRAVRIYLLVALTFLLYFTGLDSFPAIDPAEAYYTEAAREMVELGDYITPHLNYQIYFSKPIITFWLIAASYKLLGVSELASRLPFAMLVAALLASVYLAVSRIFSRRAGFASAFCLATSPMLLLVSRKSPIDIAFTFFLSVALLSTALTLNGKARFAWVALYVSLALSVLTKGPAALVLYAAAIVLFLFISRPSLTLFKSWLAALRPVAGLLIFLAVAVPWHVAVWQATNGLFLKVFFIYENIGRFKGITNIDGESWWFFGPVLLYGFFPGVLFLALAFARGLQPIRARIESSWTETAGNSMLAKLNSLSLAVGDYVRASEQRLTLTLLFSSMVMTVSMFSTSTTKLATYILPAIVPMSVLTGYYIDRLVEDKTPGKGLLAAAFLYGIGTTAALAAAIVWSLKWDDTTIYMRVAAVLAAIPLALGGVLFFRALKSNRIKQGFVFLATTLAISQAVLVPLIFHVLCTSMQKDLRTLCSKLRWTEDQIGLFGLFAPSSIFYSRRPVDTFFWPQQIVKCDPKIVTGYDGLPIQQSILIREKDFARFKSGFPGQTVLVEKCGMWGWYRIPGYKVQSVPTLEDTFGNPETFDYIMSGKSDAGPLAVPYAPGKRYSHRLREQRQE